MKEGGRRFEESGEGSGFLNHLPAILWQRRLLLIVPLVLFSLAGIAAALLVPAVYRSSAVLLVESPLLPANLVGSPDTTLIDQRIARIRQQVLSREHLIELIEQYDLYEEERQSAPLPAITDRMRAATALAAVNNEISQEDSNLTAFSMSFDYEDAEKAQLVMQQFVEQFLRIDSTQMAERAADTVAFVEEQADRLRQQIAEVEGRITAIKAANGAALASAGVAVTANPGSYASQVAALRRENAQLQQQANTVTVDPNVAAAETQLANARAIYTETHPDVVFARQRLEEARQLAAANRDTGASSNVSAQIAANNAQIGALLQAQANASAQSSSLRAQQSRAPALMEQIAQLENRAATLYDQYRTVSANLLAAQNAETLEADQMGERLSVAQPASMPTDPISLDPRLLLLGGVLAGLLVGLAMVLIVEAFLRPIRGATQIEKMLGVAPLVVVPTLKTGSGYLDRLMFWKRRRIA